MSKDNKDSIFDQLENKTNVRKEDLMKLAKSVSSKDLNDEFEFFEDNQCCKE